MPDEMSHGVLRLHRSDLMRAGAELKEEGASRPEILPGPKTAGLQLDQAMLLHPPVSPQSRLVSLTDNGNLGAEKFMLLSARLKDLQDQRRLKRVLLTSSVKNEGKSLVAANLAISLARSTKEKVLLLEGDLRQPALSRLFGTSPGSGLGELLNSSETPGKFLYRLVGLSLWLVFAGPIRKRALELLQSSRLPQLLNEFAETFDWIVIDAPPVLPLADADIWAHLSDGVLVVVRENQTPKKTLQKALDGLRRATLIGLVLNEASGPAQIQYED